MNALRSVKNVLSMTRRKSEDEEDRNLYGTSMESDITTDGEGGETEGEGKGGVWV